MRFSYLNNRAYSEILSIISIMAIFSYFELNFGVLDRVLVAVVSFAPGLQDYLVVLAGSGWIGLLVYSYIKRSQSKLAVRAKRFLEAKIENQKLINATTGLPNREAFDQIVNNTTILQEFPCWSFLGVDIANISSIRNVHGKESVSDVEVALAKALKEILNDQEFIAHDDQSVFYILCVGEVEDEVAFRVDQIVEKLSLISEFGVGIDSLDIQVQFRFALLAHSKVDREVVRTERGSIARRIGFALQQTRPQENGNVVVFDERFEAKLQRRVMMGVELQKAIDKGEIVPYFQPFIDMKTDEVVGFEVLARWRHPVEGLILPGEFVPIAEEQGMLAAMTASIMRQACMIAKRWPEHIRLAINISPTDLWNEKLIASLLKIVQDVAIDPGRLEIEITENAFIDEASNVRNAISMLKEQGISISIDDFGTGYSSLHHLRLLPFDKIKIDRSFIKDITTNSESLAIVKSVIALGDSLGLPIIAEGIDQDSSRDVLEELGCALGQGFLFAKPFAADRVDEFLCSQKRSNENRLAIVA